MSNPSSPVEVAECRELGVEHLVGFQQSIWEIVFCVGETVLYMKPFSPTPIGASAPFLPLLVVERFFCLFVSHLISAFAPTVQALALPWEQTLPPYIGLQADLG